MGRLFTPPPPVFLSVSGRWFPGEDRAAMVPRVLNTIAADPAWFARRFFYLKDYDRWRGQGGTCEYYMGPKHGTIVARVEANANTRLALASGWRPSLEHIIATCEEFRRHAVYPVMDMI